MSQQIILQQQWMSLVGPKTTCSIIHPHSSCFYEIFEKCKEVVAASSKLYALLYIAMFVMKFKKIRSQRKIQKTIFIWSKDYLWSLAFMCWTVGGMKSALCLLNALGSPLNGRIAPVLSLFASPSIFLLEKSRGYEVSMFAFVRACRSIYIYLKKRYNFSINSEKELSFIALYAMLSWFYFEKNDCIKNKNFLNSLWGDF